jgi:hypothetical protein
MSRHLFTRVLAVAVLAAALVSAYPAAGAREPRSLPRARGERAPALLQLAWRWLTGAWMEEGVVIDPNGKPITSEPTEPRPTHP